MKSALKLFLGLIKISIPGFPENKTQSINTNFMK